MKWNVANGGPAPESVTNAIFKNACALTHYKTLVGTPDIDLTKIGSVTLHQTEVVVFDSVNDWANLQVIFVCLFVCLFVCFVCVIRFVCFFICLFVCLFV